MKKHLSVFALIARAGIYKLLLLFLILAVVECALFYFGLQNAMTNAVVLERPPVGMEYVFSSGKVFWFSAVIFLLTTVQLCRVGCNFGSRQSYTLQRLRISCKSVFIWQAAFNALSFMMFWAMQLSVALALCQWYVSAAGETGGQAVMLAFYRHKFLHSLLPLSDVTRYIRNIMLVLSLGICAAKFVWSNHRGKLGVEIIAVTALTLVFFAGETAVPSTDYLVSFCAAAVGFGCIYSVFAKEADDEED